jgi:iron complex transport system substrate-binding protein
VPEADPTPGPQRPTGRIGQGQPRYRRKIVLESPQWGFERPNQKTVTLLPSHSEIIVALGAADTLVGVSDAERPTDFEKIPRVGGLSPRWEVLVALAPAVILADSAHERFRPDFDRFNLSVKFYPATHAKSIEDVFKIIRDVSETMDRRVEGEELLTRLRQGLSELEFSAPAGPHPRAFFEIWAQPLQGVAPGSLQGHLLERAGFKNIVPDTRTEMPLISAEWVAAQKPEIIFHTGLSSPAVITTRAGWKKIPAVKNNNIVLLEPDLISRAGPRVVEALAALRRVRVGEDPK